MRTNGAYVLFSAGGVFCLGPVAEEVSKLGGNSIFMFLESLGIKPQQARLIHVLEQDEPIVLGNIFPVGVMIPVLA